VASVLLVFLIVAVVVTGIVIFLYKRKKNKRRAENFIVTTKPPVGPRTVQLKPLMSFVTDETGLSKIKMISGDYDNVDFSSFNQREPGSFFDHAYNSGADTQELAQSSNTSAV